MAKPKPLDPLLVTRGNIDWYPQNRVGLIVEDLVKLGIEPVQAQLILIARGVNKWFYARSQIIRLKDEMRHEIAGVLKEITELKLEMRSSPPKQRLGQTAKLFRLRGRRDATDRWRKEIRRICHGLRWQIPYPTPMFVMPDTGVAQLAKIHDLQGELQDALRENKQLKGRLLRCEIRLEEGRSSRGP